MTKNSIWPKQMLSRRVRVDLEVMLMKDHSKLPTAPEMESHANCSSALRTGDHFWKYVLILSVFGVPADSLCA